MTGCTVPGCERFCLFSRSGSYLFFLLPACHSFERFRSASLFPSTVGHLLFRIGWFQARTDGNDQKERLAAKGLEPERQLGEVFVLENFLSFFLFFFCQVSGDDPKWRGTHVMGWNGGFSARGCDATENLGVNQLAGGVALPKLLYRAAPSSGFFSDSEFLLLLFIAYIELNFCPTAC